MRISFQNVGARQRDVRTLIGTLLVLAAPFSWWWLVAPGLVLLITASFSYCPLCHAFSVGAKEGQENFYLSHLPRYNSGPVCIINRSGNFKYTNAPFQMLLPDVSSLSELGAAVPADLGALIQEERQHRLPLKIGELSFQVNLKGVSAIDAVVGFFTDITEVTRMNMEIINTQKEIVYTMGEIGETRSKETGHHVRRVAEYSRLLALGYGLSTEEASLIQMASPMHDIGKVGIADSILKKPGKLTFDEFEIMKTHAQMGHDMLNHSERPILKAAAIIAGQHHEKWSGEGYPAGLAGEEIHIYGRITAVADVFDALGSDRVYKKAWPLERILSLFREERGRHFDPALVDVLFNKLDQFKEIRDRFRDVAPHEQSA